MNSDENLTQDRAQTEPKAPFKTPNRPQKTMLKLVDVTGNTLTTTSIQLQPHNAPAT
ncbi:MAG TPA: hypothetical protein VJ249_02690 [Candidatus Bathyarchaeia archaeon]|nr:hypothetical protein [Candidatus Bathyarchaeia archaeon]